MKRFLLFTISLITSIAIYAAKEYSVSDVYEKQALSYGTLALDNYDNIKEVRYLLVPTKLKEGKYKVTLKRLDSNVYSVVGTDYIIKTRYCYEYGYSIDAILIVDNSWGVNTVSVFM